ncbi:hypothetical protein [Leptospira vanthielii]|uniref:Uncharacterized protein n=1 Tax=Leptospira vanthielii serovar Holland str. Waz Holland = ATCC 700522 TaxID=1218591 RepID=N1WHM2_9LEPT|nr:hypothetical protein [Leptospira vanthielii]EMY71366.1 hypothetical protein LEP1GSC199_3722 [Leptospira vanthielii serovar Holland str. Waz Holland = ATCC 700522]
MLPIQSVWLIRISLIYLILGSLLGSLLMFHKAFGWNPEIWKFLPLHYSILIWGFFIQLIMGTAYWMFPKFLSEHPRGSSKQAWLMFSSYNLGLILYLITKFFIPIDSFALLGKCLIFFGLLTFMRLAWVRIISYT